MNKIIFLLLGIIILSSGCIYSNNTTDVNTNFSNDSINDTIIRNYTIHIKAGSFSRDTSLASGTQVITGVGFKPSFVDFMALIPATNKTSWGIDDGVTPGVMYFNSATSVYGVSAGASIGLVTSATILYTGKVQSFDNDGFTVIWTKTGLPTGTATVIYKAYR